MRADRSLAKALPTPLVVALAADPSIRVRLQAALVLGDRSGDEPQAVRGLVGLASHDAADPWMRLAILGGLGETALPFLREWAATRPDLLDSPSPEQARLLEEAAAILGVRRREGELASFLEVLGPGRKDNEAAPSADRPSRAALRTGGGT